MCEEVSLLSLCEDALGHIASCVPATDRVCLALACRRFRAHTSYRTYVFASPERLRWARSLGYARLHLEWYAAYYCGDVDVVRVALDDGGCHVHAMNARLGQLEELRKLNTPDPTVAGVKPTDTTKDAADFGDDRNNADFTKRLSDCEWLIDALQVR